MWGVSICILCIILLDCIRANGVDRTFIMKEELNAK